jgi:phosphatidylglycerol---prolipoprotein diacylglyceryl transferase
MTFPVTIDVFGWSLPPHPVLEFAGYAAGSQLFLWQRQRGMRSGAYPKLPPETTAWLVVAMLAGAAIGAIGLASLEHLGQPSLPGTPLAPGWLAGKTIVGGLLGGWLGIELAKRALHVGFTTGDWFVLPIAAGIALGRVGCFLTGLEDGTYGTPTSLPWGVDFGDGLARHPTQLYEAIFVTLLGASFLLRRQPATVPGRHFREFLGAYFLFRLGVEFIKPVQPLALGLSAIQWASLAGVVWCFVSWRRLRPASVAPG